MSTVNTQLRVVELAELLMPGTLFSESDVVELHGRSVEELARTVNNNVFAIVTYKVLEGTFETNGKTVKVTSERFDVSPRTYIGGEVYNLQQVKAMSVDETLVNNMVVNKWPQVIKCRTGNWQPFEPNKGEILLAVS
ncbi:MAG: hypothetical protein HYU80_04245 [Candidatus Blackburnbacteria bacterium]|nr:hypothetical protein [Candidatus Blackburnbacteria bacterium]